MRQGLADHPPAQEIISMEIGSERIASSEPSRLEPRTGQSPGRLEPPVGAGAA